MESVLSRRVGPRLLIADDHAIFAETLKVYLEKTYTVVGVVNDGCAMVAEAMRLRPDLIIVDVGMPLLNGLDAAWRIRKQNPNISFVFLTMRDEPNLAAAALNFLHWAASKFDHLFDGAISSEYAPKFYKRPGKVIVLS